MIVPEELRKEIRDDIIKCESHTEVSGSESLYGVLVAKYSVLDSDFNKNLSTNGKVTVLGSEFDYRPELKAIAAKLRMWLLFPEAPIIKENRPLSPKEKLKSFILRGEDIRESESHPAQHGFPSYVQGPKFDIWMSEINIFAERHLKNHPLYFSISTTFLNRKNKSSSCDDMLSFLYALDADDDFWNETLDTKIRTAGSIPKTIQELLSDDIRRCKLYLSNPSDEKSGQDLYLEITGRYDSLIRNFGSGLYQYYAEQHFYDHDISADTLEHNLKVLLNKMISYQSQKYYDPKSGKKEVQRILSNKIFIVHGHDVAAKETMARTLEKAGFKAIILHEQANTGHTIIEKIEANTDVSFAVILYTMCDVGRSNRDNEENNKFRARQNVVFEHGYLIGKLGRSRVCALVKGDVETPGDISGVIYIPMDDAGAWKSALGKEMISAGLSVDLNKFFL